MSAPVIWFEVLGRDADKLAGFYSELFDWSLNLDNPMKYGMVDKNGDGIPGGVGQAQQGPGWTTFYVGVKDLGATLKRAEDLGAKVLLPVTKVSDETTIAVIADPEGHPIGLAAQ